MAGRHAFTPEVAKGAFTSPAGRGMAAAAVVGTMFGVALPAAHADTANDPVAQPAATQTAATDEVTAPATAEWDVTQVAVDVDVDEADVLALDASVTLPEATPVVAEIAQTEAAATTTQATTTTQAATTASSTAVEASTTAVSSYSGSAAAVVSTALSYVGSPYVWGGTTPSGWDCIGFVRYVYGQLGVSIGGYTTSVLSVGYQVSYSEVQPGDILYWPGHVAIYAGNGQNVGAWNESMGTTTGPNSWLGTPTVIRVFG